MSSSMSSGKSDRLVAVRTEADQTTVASDRLRMDFESMKKKTVSANLKAKQFIKDDKGEIAIKY